MTGGNFSFSNRIKLSLFELIMDEKENFILQTSTVNFYKCFTLLSRIVSFYRFPLKSYSSDVVFYHSFSY